MGNLLLMASVFAASFAIGYLLISRVPPRLHTPLMSMTNAISAVTILGGILLFSVETTLAQKILGALAIALAAFNVVGGFSITDRMLKMFHKKEPPSS
jgi:NAD(P) transhydrogenase subunit alpha